MALFRCVVCLTLFTCAASAALVKTDGPDFSETPIGKVTDLLRDLLDDVQREGRTEARTYDHFSCFCKENSDKKSDEIKALGAKIKSKSTDIELYDTQRNNDETNIKKLGAELDELHRKDDESQARCDKEHMQYKEDIDELQRGIDNLQGAIESMTRSEAHIDTIKPDTSFLEVRTELIKTLTLSQVVGKASATRQQALSLLQSKNAVDPDAPGYGFHSDDIVAVCQKLKQEWIEEHTDMTEEYEKSKTQCRAEKRIFYRKSSQSNEKIGRADNSAARNHRRGAEAKKDLIGANDEMKEMELYLTDLTRLCEERAKDWDQRSQARQDEVRALEEGIQILRGATRADNLLSRRGANIRDNAEFLQNASASKPAKVSEAGLEVGSSIHKLHAAAATVVSKSLSFIQETSSQGSSSKFLSRDQLSLELEARKNRAIATLRTEGQRLGSFAISSLAIRLAQEPSYLAKRAAGDPFQKVKGLIQRLIERLLEESKSEASKKGFCDTEVGKAETERDHRFEQTQALSADLAKLEAKDDQLSADIVLLNKDIEIEKAALIETTYDRDNESGENRLNIRIAKEGKEQVTQAIVVLKDAYKELAKPAALVQTSASPVLEDMDKQGREMVVGTYHGAQEKTGAIFALLETIEDDFDRTARKTQEAEDAAQRDFVEFSQATQASIGGKETKKTLNTQDLETTRIGIKTKTTDLQTAMDLCDAALQELEQLKPTCIDTGMSYSERVKKREEEITALEGALKILKPPAL
jgi:hypothetical protein